MSHYILSHALSQYRDQSITVGGWIHRVRQLGGLTFVVLRDPRGLLQIVHQPEDPPLPMIAPETVVKVTGVVTPELRAPGGFELRQPVVHVLSRPSGPLPFYLGGPQLEAGMDLRLNEAAFSLRHPQSQRIFRVQAALTAGFRRALTERQFVEVQTPKILATASESGANVFKLSYFDTDAYLAQSPQFYKQMMVGVVGAHSFCHQSDSNGCHFGPRRLARGLSSAGVGRPPLSADSGGSIHGDVYGRLQEFGA